MAYNSFFYLADILNMVRFYIAALILTFCWASNAELTSSDEIEASEPSTDVYSKNTCSHIETQFQNYLVNIMDDAISASSKSYHCLMGGIRNNGSDCKKLNSMNLGNLKKYRRSLKKLYQEMANNWVKEKSKEDVRFKNCLGLPVQFERNIRRVRPKLPHHLCQPITTRWAHEIDGLTQEYFDGKRTITSLDSEEIASLKAFHYSPLKRIIATNALFDSRLTDSELKQKLASAYNAMKSGTEKLKNKISKLKDHEKHILFDFQNQFTVFTNSLPDEKRPKAKKCIESSGFFHDCGINILNQGLRCGSRIYVLGKELIPIITLIDSLGGMGNVMAAEASGVMTSSEATEKRAQLITTAVFGIGGVTAGGASLAKSFVRSKIRTGPPKKYLLKDPPEISGKQLVSSHAKETAQLEKMGVNYSAAPDLDSYVIDDIKDNLMVAKNFDPSNPPVQSVLRIREGATKGRRHNNPRGLALKHKDIDAKIKEAEQMGVKVVIDTSINKTSALGYYRPEEKILAISSKSNWLTFEHEFQHALFDKYLRGHILRDSPLSSTRLISRSNQTLRQMRQQLPAQIRRHWSKEEQNVILQYMKDDIPELALNERLSANRQLELLGWRRYTPSGQQISNYATRHLINELNRGGRASPLTARQRSIRNQAHITNYAQNAYSFLPEASVATAVGFDLRNENSSLLNLPRNIRSAIQSAKEVFYSERGILVKDQNGQAQFFPSEKKK